MKVEAMVLSVVNVQEAYAKALLVDRRALADRQDSVAGRAMGYASPAATTRR